MKKIYSRNFLFSLVFLLALEQNGFSQGTIPYGNSYVNMSKKAIGGIIEKNDTLEIRNTYYFPIAYNPIYKVRFLANVPSYTQIISTDSLRIISNEGVTLKKYTYAASDDAATYVSTPPAGEYNIRINIGSSATIPLDNSITDITGAGTITPNVNLQKLNGTLITTAFRVKVTGNPGDTIILGSCQFIYKRSSAANPDTAVNSTRYKILIDSTQILLCPNVKGVNIAAEMGGTFDSGITQNRSNLTNPIPGYTYTPLTPSNPTNDGRYCIVNNLSPYAGTYQNPEMKPNCPSVYPDIHACVYRSFIAWDVMGDHTGTNDSIGNPPAAVGTKGGYMLSVNASYAMCDAYRQQITNLCPNTTYEFSAWIKNVCHRCGIDINGAQSYTIGVYPNLTFVVDSIDRYSSGTIDTVGWQKKGFTFITGPSQTSVDFAIRNNAPGGGGNDWVMDDIAIATCYPDLRMSPKDTVVSCRGLRMFLSDTVRSITNTYTNYCWEKSADGVNWISTGSCGTAAPAIVNGTWEYVVDTSFINVAADSGTYYRLKVATTPGNLTDVNCSINNSQKIFLKVYDVNCRVLETNSLAFTAQAINDNSILTWTNLSQKDVKAYNIEKSNDGKNFTTLSTVNSSTAKGVASYKFEDPSKIEGLTFYRIKMLSDDNSPALYSNIVSVNNKFTFTLAVNNPFSDCIKMQITTPEKGLLKAELFDAWGRMVTAKTFITNKGLSNSQINGLQTIHSGFYILRLKLNGKSAESKLIKLTH